MTIALLLVSWGSPSCLPYLGYKLLDPMLAAKHQAHEDIYETGFYRRFRSVVEWCVQRRWLVIGATLVAFVLALVAFNGGVQKQFSRRRVGRNCWTISGCRRGVLKASEAVTKRVEAMIARTRRWRARSNTRRATSAAAAPFLSAARPEAVLRQFCAAGHHDPWDRGPRGSQTAPGSGFRGRKREWATSGRASCASRMARRSVSRCSSAFPGDLPTLRRAAEEMAEIMRAHPNIADVSFDWHEMAKAVRLEIDQERARALGVSVQDISFALNTLLVGTSVTQLRGATNWSTWWCVRAPTSGAASMASPASTCRPRWQACAAGAAGEDPLRARAGARSGDATACRP